MAETNATILIPDISGFTEFMTNTEHSHSLQAITMLINAIIEAVGDEYEISEIEGDAVLMFKKGPSPSTKEIQDTCLKIFNAFHFRRQWMQQHAVCPCKACLEISNLTLKFVAHHGVVSEMKVGRFITLTGTDVIVAHRLLKNSVPSNEYLLLSEQLLQHTTDTSTAGHMEWRQASEEYTSIGKIPYRFTLLNEAREKVPKPPAPPDQYRTDHTPYFEIPIAANYMDVYMTLMNIPGRAEWLYGLQKVEQDMPAVFVGSLHYCTFENYKATLSPLRMTLLEEGILFAESCQVQELHLSIVHEFIIKHQSENSCVFAVRFLNAGDAPIPEEEQAALTEQMQRMAISLKEYCEKNKTS